MRATSALKREAGTSTNSWSAWSPLRMRVRRSAIGSVTVGIVLPARLRKPRDHALVRELAQADPAEPELALVRARPPAAAAAVVPAGLVLRRALLAHPL